MARFYIAAALVAGMGLAAYLLWVGGINHERNRAEAETAKARIETILGTKDARDAAKNLDDDGLFNALSRWILPD